jgi:hypothetical protein
VPVTQIYKHHLTDKHIPQRQHINRMRYRASIARPHITFFSLPSLANRIRTAVMARNRHRCCNTVRQPALFPRSPVMLFAQHHPRPGQFRKQSYPHSTTATDRLQHFLRPYQVIFQGAPISVEWTGLIQNATTETCLLVCTLVTAQHGRQQHNHKIPSSVQKTGRPRPSDLKLR